MKISENYNEELQLQCVFATNPNPKGCFYIQAIIKFTNDFTKLEVSEDAYVIVGNDNNFFWDKVQLQNLLQPTLLNKINITIYFENLTIELHVLHALITHVKFCVN